MSDVSGFLCGLKDVGDLNASCGDVGSVTLQDCSNNCQVGDIRSANSLISCQQFQGLNLNHRYQFVVQAKDSKNNLSQKTSQCIALPYNEVTNQMASIVLATKYNGAWVSTLNRQNLLPELLRLNYQSSPNGLNHNCELKNETSSHVEFNSSCDSSHFSKVLQGQSGDLYSFVVKASGATVVNSPLDSTTFRLDNTAPLVSIPALNANSYGPNSVSLAYTISDLHSGVDFSRTECRLVN